MAGYFDKGWVCGILKDKYYVYALFDTNGFPFYIGKGKNQRVNNRLKPTNRREVSFKNRKIESILKSQGYVRREILAYCSSEEEAYDLEEFMIAAYGLRNDGGCLTNVLKSHNEVSTKFAEGRARWEKSNRQLLVSDERILEVYEKYLTTHISLVQAAKELGISASYVSSIFEGTWRKDLNLRKPDKTIMFRTLDLETVRSIYEDRGLGMSYKQLVDKYGVSKTTVARICNKEGKYALIFDSQSENSPVGSGTAKTIGSGRDSSAANLEGKA